jgi:DNA-binding transcriptional regulator YiaG
VCALLGICHRTVEVCFPSFSMHQRLRRGVATEPKTLGEHLRRVRIDRRLTNVQVAHVLGVAYQTVEKWEHNRAEVGPNSRAKVIAFIEYDPLAGSTLSNG